MGNCHLIAGSTKSPTSKSNSHSHVVVTTYTWARDSHGLFDYESKSLTKKVFKAQGTGVIKRSTNDIGFIKDGDKTVKLGDKDLLKLNLRQGNFWIDPCVENDSKLNKEQTMAPDSSSLEQDPWLVIKSFKTNANKGYKLNEGDLIKLGRVKYRIREIKGTPTLTSQKNENPEKQVVNTEVDNNISADDSFKKSPRIKKDAQGSITQACRICLSESCDPGDPFFSPCNCSGTMKLIHVKCLQTWLKSKLHIKNAGNTTFIYWKALECELCKTPYPQSFEVENKRYDVVEIERPDCAYIVVEVLSKEKNIARGVHLIKMEGKNNIRLGRGHDSDIRITDISVSRCHAIIKLDKGNFYIEDNNSKFGTLLHLDKSIPLTGEYNNISVQIGRTILSLTAKKGRGLFPICFGQNSTENNPLTEKNPDLANGIFEQNEPKSPVMHRNSQIASNAATHNRTVSLNTNNRERNYRVDAFHSNSLVLQNSPVAAESRVQMPNQHLQNPVQNNNVRRPSVSENEGNVGEEADERSFYD